MSVRILQGDARAVLPTLADKSVDCVVTDPPYNVGCNYVGYNDRQRDRVYRTMIRDVLTQAARVSTDTVIFFPGRANVDLVRGQLLRTGLHVHHHLGWRRREFAGDIYSHHHPCVSWEPIIWASQTRRPYCAPIHGHAGRDFLDLASHRRGPGLGFPCPKPLEVMKWLVQLACPPGGTVLDPFAGSGTTGEAAIALGCNAILVELVPEYVDIARRRTAQRGLFPLEATA